MDRSPLPPNITGRTAFLKLLAQEGITHLFGNPGTTELAIMEAMSQQSAISYVLGLQESVVVGMADGYARASNNLAACNVHVAPGLGNAMGALYNAKFYGSPVLITAGQQEQGHGLMEPMLYDPLGPIAQPMVKWAIDVTRVQDLPRIVHRPAKGALTPPTRPVFISLPADILDADAPLEGMPIVQISERDWELGKNYPTECAIRANVKETLRALNAVLRSRMTPVQKSTAAARLADIAKNNWSVKRAKACEEASKLESARPMDPKVLMMRISDALPNNAVVVEEGLTSTFPLLNFLRLRDHQGFYGLASGGIGFAMGGAVCVGIALPDRPVVAIVGDGSAMYSIQPLWTASHMNVPMTYVIPNNRSYRILKERLVSVRQTDKVV